MYIYLHGLSGVPDGVTFGQMPTQPSFKSRVTMDILVADLRGLLERRLRADDAAGIQDRRRRLIQLFESLRARPWDAQELFGRLFFLPNDPLGRLFRYRLATPTRNRLRRILEDIVRDAYSI